MNAVTGMIGGTILAFLIALGFAVVGINLGPIGVGIIVMIGACSGATTGAEEEKKAQAAKRAKEAETK